MVADSKPKKVTWQFQPLATGHFMLLQNPHPWLVHPPVWSFPRRDSQWQVQQWFPNYRQRWQSWKATNLRPSRKMLPKDTAFNWWWWIWRGLINGFNRHHAYKTVLEWKKIDPWIKSHLYESNNRNRWGSSQPFDLTKSKIAQKEEYSPKMPECKKVNELLAVSKNVRVFSVQFLKRKFSGSRGRFEDVFERETDCAILEFNCTVWRACMTG